ncbi:UNVERIFIED_CONTAM: hypothetical protein RMT77_008198 [Armadillidium vulgare]
MQVFTPCLNPVTGEKEWSLQPEDYDFKQEIARSSYADMLHDKERNEIYFEGIRRSVSLLKNQGKEVHVLDIGTGTGLLSLMAVSCGVDSVIACEAFTPMAECAKEILKINGASDKVKLISKRSTEIECGEGKEMPRRANLLVTEVFDTELIGEGAIETYSHAIKNLLTPDALFVPAEGTVYAQVISSDLIRKWNILNPVYDDGISSDDSNKVLLRIPNSVIECAGTAAVHDVQLSEISSQSFTPLSESIPVFEFDWSGRNIPLVKKRHTSNSFESLSSGNCDAVFMWWDLKMDPQREIILSCAPLWDHPLTKGNTVAKSSEIPWRDHWMQAIYYFPKTLSVNKSEKLTLISSHDEYSLWFNLLKDNSEVEKVRERPVCDCGVHALTARSRLGQLNDSSRRSLLLRALKKYVNKDTVCLFMGDSPYLAVVVAKLGARHVYVHERSSAGRKVFNQFIESNQMSDKVTILTSSLADITLENIERISLVFCEPFFETSILPWHPLQFLYQLKSCSHLLAENAVVLPQEMTLWGLPVQFRDLWKIRYPLDTCCGFDMKPFDKLIDKACDEIDEPVEPQPLWEYPSIALGSPCQLLSIPLKFETLQEKKIETQHIIPLQSSGTLNGMALWCDWHFPEGVLSTGTTRPVSLGEQVHWDMNTRQGVYLFKKHHVLNESTKTGVVCDTSFSPCSGNWNFKFDVAIK